MVEAVFEKNKNTAMVDRGLYQWDYGQTIAFVNAGLPSPVEVHFAVSGKDAVTMIGTTENGRTEAPIPDELLKIGLPIVAYAFVADAHSGATIRTAAIPVTKRPKPEDYDPPTPTEETLFREAIRQVQEKAEAAETAKRAAEDAQTKAAAAQKAAEDAKTKAETAKTTAENRAKEATEAATAAAQAKTAAETAQRAAEDAQTKAAAAQKAAEDAKTKAETAQRAAEDRAKEATEAATAAAQAKTAAETARRAAEEQARAAAGSATTATAQARAASKSADWAKDYAADAAGSAGAAQESAEAAERYYDAFVKSSETKVKIDALFRYPRTGKIYTVKIPRYASNQTIVCEKLDDNAGLVCEPSTDTAEGQDDYADIPLFRWYNCNYVREDNGHAVPTAIEGLDDSYTTEGNVDVGVIQMAPYIKWDDSNADYILLSITDSPRDGYTLWSTARYGEETYPYVIHSKYFSGYGPDGLLRSLPGIKPERGQSHNGLITNYAKKGAGYTGARMERNTWQIVMMLIKYAKKSAQAMFAGTTNYSWQYPAAVQRDTDGTFFPVTKAQAANILVGSYVSVGYGAISNGTLTTDRGYDNMSKYADEVKVLRIEAIDDNTSAVYLDVSKGFNTAKVALSDTITSDVYISSMHWHSGITDAVIGHRDGTPVSNTDGKRPYRVQGIEYAVGGYFVASDTAYEFVDSAGAKQLRACPDGVAHTNNETTIKANYKAVGTIPAGDFWVGDIGIDVETCTSWNATKGSGSPVGYGDYNYGGGTPAAGALRETLQGGGLGAGSSAGPACASAWNGIGSGWWSFLAAD